MKYISTMSGRERRIRNANPEDDSGIVEESVKKQAAKRAAKEAAAEKEQAKRRRRFRREQPDPHHFRQLYKQSVASMTEATLLRL